MSEEESAQIKKMQEDRQSLLTQVMLKRMQEGENLSLNFRPASGIPTTFTVALAPYRELHAAIQELLAKKP